MEANNNNPYMKLSLLSVDEMLNRPEKGFNPQIWKERINRLKDFEKIQFYVIESDKVYSYARFYASYIINGLYLFNEVGYSCSLTNNGFCKVQIDEQGNLYKDLFVIGDKTGYAENCETNKNLFKMNLTPLNIMVSNCI